MIRWLLAMLALAMLFPVAAQARGSNKLTEKTEPAVDRQLFALLLRPGVAWQPGRPFAEQGLRPHFEYWMSLFRAGRVVSAGPLGVDGGLVLLLARDLTEARAVAAADPAVASGIFVTQTHLYAPPMINGSALKADK